MMGFSESRQLNCREKSEPTVFEITSLSLFPIFLAGNKRLACGLFSFYICSKLLRNRELVLQRVKSNAFLVLLVIILLFYIMGKGHFDPATLKHALNDSTLYPVTVFDYLILLLTPILTSFLPISTLEFVLIAASFALSSVLHFFIALYFEGGLKLFTILSWSPIFEILPGWPDQSRRVAGFSNPNILAFFAVSASFTSIGLFKAALTALKAEKSIGTNRPLAICLAFIGVLGLISSTTLVFWSGSRASLLVFFLTAVIMAFFYRARLVMGALVTLGIFIALQLSGRLAQIGIDLPGIGFDRIAAMISNFNSSESERINIFSCFWRQSLQSPLTGQGIFNSTINCEKLANYPPYGFNHGHNIFLHPASELGLPATFLMLCLILCLLFRGSKANFKSTTESYIRSDLRIGFLMTSIACLCLSMTSLAMLHSYPLLLMFCLFLGIAGTTNAAD